MEQAIQIVDLATRALLLFYLVTIGVVLYRHLSERY